MNRSAKVREVYAEFRHIFSNKMSEREALEHAVALVNLFTLDDEEELQFDLRIGGLPFDQWALDIAMADGGWRVLGQEPWLARDLDEEEEHEQMLYQELARLSDERAMA